MHKLFASQLDDEKIYLVVRRHWFFLAKRLIILFLFVLAYAFITLHGTELAPGLFSETTTPYTTILLRLGLMMLLLALLIIWVLYYLNMQIITNMRLVDIDQYSLFARSVTELNIRNVQDVTSESHGLFPTLFGYGDVIVQTAGTEQRFTFEMVSHPEEIKKLLLDLYEQSGHNLKMHSDVDATKNP
jgi:hypothetical protein